MNAAFSELGGKWSFKQQIWSLVRFSFFFFSAEIRTRKLKQGFALEVSGITGLGCRYGRADSTL